MTEANELSEDDTDLISSLFQSLGEWVRRFGTTDILPFTHEWQSVGAHADLSARVLFSDGGGLRFQAAFAEQIRIDLRADTDNTKVWQSIETRYDQFGNMRITTSVSDEDVQREDIIENGKRVASRFTDLSGLLAWNDITNFYDENGLRTEKVTHFIDGRQRQDIFENGLRLKTIISDFSDDSDFEWETITYQYDASGQRTSKTTIYDDGSERIESFLDGVRTSVSRTDGADADWSSLQVLYSSLGDISERTVTYDDGVERLERFAEQDLVQVVQTDVLDSRDWLSIERTYNEEGQVERNETLFDDGDLTVIIYIDGERDTRIELDADGDEDWLYRVTYYDPDGVSGVETYFTEDGFDLSSLQAGDSNTPLEEVGPIETPLELLDFNEPDPLL